MRPKTLLAILGILVLCAGLLTPGNALAKKQITIGTASMGGAYYPVGTGIASIVNKYVPELDVRVEVTGGGVENPRLVGKGETDLGITNTSTGYFSYKGMKPYTQKYPVRAICLMYPSTFQMFTRKESGLKTVADIKGKRAAVGPAGGGTILLLNKMLPLYNMTSKDFTPSFISFNDGSMALKDGNVDAAFVLAGAPSSAITELQVRTPIRFLEIDEAMVKKFVTEYPYYIRIVMPKSFYNTESEILTVGSGNLLIVNEKMSADIAYKITAALYDHVDEFRKVHPATKSITLESAPTDVIPMHPGAERYFKEKGVLK